jgi:hypothetical protein
MSTSNNSDSDILNLTGLAKLYKVLNPGLTSIKHGHSHIHTV